MDLTYEEYVNLGGIAPESLFNRLKADAENDLSMLQRLYEIEWNSEEARTLAMVCLIDNANGGLQAIQAGGHATSIKVGSYSESRQNAGTGGALGALAGAQGIISRYASLYRKKVGVFG